MMICRGDTHPNLELFDQVEGTWPIRPLFLRSEAVNPAPAGRVPGFPASPLLRSKAVNPAPAGPGSRLLHYEKAGE